MTRPPPPWLGQYPVWAPAEITPEYDTMLELFAASVAGAPQAEAIRYFDGVLTAAELAARSDALALGLLARGFVAGDRLALYLQNNPSFVVGLLGVWKAGGIAVLVNPMNKARELTYLLVDSGARALLCLDELHDSVVRGVLGTGETSVEIVITCSALDDQRRDDPRLFAGLQRTRPAGTIQLDELIAEYAGRTPPPVPLAGSDVAVLTYTSGTTGLPKGAMNTHANLVFTAQTYRDWMQLAPTDSVLAVAPLFHIMGLVGHVAVSLLVRCPLVLTHRFHPQVTLDAIREHRPTFTVGAITAFISLSNLDDVTRADFASLRVIYSGGAPIAPAVTDQFLARTGVYIHNIYGLTETTSPSHAVPMNVKAPVDPVSGALSVGVPVFNTMVRILDDDGAEVPVGQLGEIATSGPQIVAGYWHKPEASAASLPNGELRTGDVGFMDADGWFYLVDRKKDMINVAGYKVWPREVEDVLYGHPAVREAAVVGVPDDYRGETVKAYVSLKRNASATPEELIAYCSESMAAYKYPRSIEIVDELPKTTTGKILRRELRERTT